MKSGLLAYNQRPFIRRKTVNNKNITIKCKKIQQIHRKHKYKFIAKIRPFTIRLFCLSQKKYYFCKILYHILMACENNRIKDIKISDFPEETDAFNGIKIYGEASWETLLAVLSQYLHDNRHKLNRKNKKEIIAAIRSFLSYKENQQYEEITDEEAEKVAENATENSLFADFFKIPFPGPDNPSFTFIDLFAGMGGFRLAMQAQGGKCVFSSEWNKYAQKTYFANFGEMPFGDITKDITKSYIPKKFDILCAGFPCQPFSIAGVSKKKSLGREIVFKENTKVYYFDKKPIKTLH